MFAVLERAIIARGEGENGRNRVARVTGLGERWVGSASSGRGHLRRRPAERVGGHRRSGYPVAHRNGPLDRRARERAGSGHLLLQHARRTLARAWVAFWADLLGSVSVKRLVGRGRDGRIRRRGRLCPSCSGSSPSSATKTRRYREHGGVRGSLSTHPRPAAHSYLADSGAVDRRALLGART